MDQHFHQTLVDVYGKPDKDFKRRVQEAADLLWDEYHRTLHTNKTVSDSPVLSGSEEATSLRKKLLSSKKMIRKSSVQPLLNVPNEPSLKTVAEQLKEIKSRCDSDKHSDDSTGILDMVKPKRFGKFSKVPQDNPQDESDPDSEYLSEDEPIAKLRDLNEE